MQREVKDHTIIREAVAFQSRRSKLQSARLQTLSYGTAREDEMGFISRDPRERVGIGLEEKIREKPASMQFKNTKATA